ALLGCRSRGELPWLHSTEGGLGRARSHRQSTHSPQQSSLPAARPGLKPVPVPLWGRSSAGRAVRGVPLLASCLYCRGPARACSRTLRGARSVPARPRGPTGEPRLPGGDPPRTGHSGTEERGRPRGRARFGARLLGARLLGLAGRGSALGGVSWGGAVRCGPVVRHGTVRPGAMVKLTAELIEQAAQYTNAVRDRELDLRGYKIPVIENLGATLDQFDAIDFSDNEIRKLDGFPLLRRLKTLLMNNNRICRIGENLEQALPCLTELILTNNNIAELGELDPLSTIKSLTYLSILRNPVTNKKHYRLYVIHKVPQVRVLDFQKVRLKVHPRRCSAL
uniref:Uncharacterized protein n=1 Tax=Melopsittacus undulatus TaxID=13146 RepID=A0A8V5HDT6_MELUD